MSDITVNHPTGDIPEGERTWTTEELREDFEIICFAAPFVAVCRKIDGAAGSMEFTGGGETPRLYFGFPPRQVRRKDAWR
jgi:hypothetical protein